MPDYRRTGYAPWSLTREAGVESATVDGTIEVDQYLQPTIDTGFVDEKGNWKGRKSSDKDFIGITRAESIANGGEVIFPDTNVFPSIDMEGFRDIFYAIKPTKGGNYRVEAVMGPDTESFANLSPVNPASSLRGKLVGVNNENMTDCFIDGSESLTADVWNIFIVQSVLGNFRNMQFKITNNSGGASTIEFGFMRLV